VTLKLICRQQDERTSRGRSSSSKSAKSRCGRDGDRGIVTVKERWLVAAAPLAGQMWVGPYVSVHIASGPPAWPARFTRCTAAIPLFILQKQATHSVQHCSCSWPASPPVDGCKKIATTTRPRFVTARLISSRSHLRCSCRLKDNMCNTLSSAAHRMHVAFEHLPWSTTQPSRPTHRNRYQQCDTAS
jgi:hypothetical protein